MRSANVGGGFRKSRSREKDPATANQGVASYHNHNHLASVAEREPARLGQTAVLCRGDGGSDTTDTTGVPPDRSYRPAGGEESRPLDYEALHETAPVPPALITCRSSRPCGGTVRCLPTGWKRMSGSPPTGELTVRLGTGLPKGPSVNIALIDVSEERTVWQRGRRFTQVRLSPPCPFGTDERTVELALAPWAWSSRRVARASPEKLYSLRPTMT